jgi:hypothetical protein
MKRIVLLLTLTVVTAMAQQPSTERKKPAGVDSAIDDRATAALARMADFLKTVKTFKINSRSSKDEIVDTDMKIQKNASNEVSVRLPDRLHAHVRSDDHDLEFFYNGKTLTVFNPELNYYASTTAPPTVSRMLDATRARHGIDMPLADFIHMAAAEDYMQDVIGAGYLGTSRIEGVECEHIAVRQPNVDWQVWIEKGAKPLPRKVVITTKNEQTQPQFIANLTWDLSPNIDEKLFTFTPPPDAARIRFARAREIERPQTRPR